MSGLVTCNSCKKLNRLPTVHYKLTSLKCGQCGFSLSDHSLDGSNAHSEIVIAGSFNSGKSQFINALLGRSIMPVNITRTTATINRLIAGRERVLNVYYQQGGTSQKPYTSDKHLQDIIKDYMGSDSKDISRIDIVCPDELWLEHVTLVDTPGINFNADDEARSIASLRRADAIIWLISPIGLQEADNKCLIEYRETHKRNPVILVINRIDMLTRKQQLDIRRHTEKELKGITDQIFMISAELALIGKDNKHGDIYVRSRFSELLAYLTTNIFVSFKA